jgi:hypothetical protein
MKRLSLLVETGLLLALLSWGLFGGAISAPNAHAASPCTGVEVTTKDPDHFDKTVTNCYTGSTTGYYIPIFPFVTKIVNHNVEKPDGSEIEAHLFRSSVGNTSHPHLLVIVPVDKQQVFDPPLHADRLKIVQLTLVPSHPIHVTAP